MKWSLSPTFREETPTVDHTSGCTDLVILNQWYPISALDELQIGIAYQTVLLEVRIGFGVDRDGALKAWRQETHLVEPGQPIPADVDGFLPTQSSFGYLWTTLGSNPAPLFEIPEFDEPGRRNLNAASIGVATSAPRAVENFLDMGHFPFVHTGVLGAEPFTEVVDYEIEIRNGEIFATGCKFPQPQAAPGSVEPIITDYTYRIPHPYCVLLYKTGAFDARRLDVIGLFIQPLGQEEIRAHTLLSVIDDVTSKTGLRRFQLGIFSQDKPILENQVPKRLPLSPSRETPIRADKSSIAYRRWLQTMGVKYGVISDQ
ncbi:MAG: aromatic ring-hydroxylating dioxygenase subunit alpha [Ilumatobacteraceae bacterium]